MSSFSIYEDEDCRDGEPGAGQTGLTTHMPPPPLPSPFTVRVPSNGSTSSSSASSVVGLAGPTAHFPPPFSVRVPSSSSSSSATYSGVGPAGHGGLHMDSRSAPRGATGTPAIHSFGGSGVFTVKVPSASSSSTGRSSVTLSVGLPGRSEPTSSTGSFYSCRSGKSSSTASFYSCLPSAPTLIGSREPDTGPSSIPLPHKTVPGFNCTPIYGLLEILQQQGPTPAGTPQLEAYKGPHEARQGGAHQQSQLDTPPETPGARQYADSLVKDWMRKSIDQDDVASMMQEDMMPVDVAQQQPLTLTLTKPHTQPQSGQNQEQLPTPADTPESRGFKDVTAEAMACTSHPGDDVATSEQIVVSLAAPQQQQRRQKHPPGPASQGPRARTGPLGRSPRLPGRGSSRVQKNGRRRRRTDVELTMYHAIRWLGLGDVVPNVSVVTREPLVQMPLPCTFGEGPSGKLKVEGVDFAVGLSRAVVRSIERRRAERMGRGTGA